jgi:hypothetical protein
MSDWEDELREMALRANPDAPLYEDPGSGASAEPKTLTERFARSFFESYVRTDASGMLTDESRAQFLDASISSLEVDARDTLYARRDVIIGDDSEATLRAYGNLILEIIERHSFQTENELAILERAVQTDSEEDLKKLTNIADAYGKILADTLTLSAPASLVSEHIALVNAYLAIRNNIDAMAGAFSDPIYAIIRVKRYHDDVTALHVALKQVYLRLETAGIVYEADEAGAQGRWYIEH